MSDVGFAYTIGTGKLFCTLDELYKGAEDLLGYPVMTHEFAFDSLWSKLRKAMEDKLTQEVEG